MASTRMEMPSTQSQFHYYIEQLNPVHREWETEALRFLFNRFKMLSQQADRLGFPSKFINSELRMFFKCLLPYTIQVEVTPFKVIKENEMEYFLLEFEKALLKREIIKQETLIKNTFSQFYRDNTLPSKPSCVFCERTDHSNRSCPKSRFDRVEAIKSKGLCYSCLNPGHISRDCVLNIQCQFCGHDHYDYMCNQRFRRPTRNMHSGVQQKSVRSNE